MATKKKTDYVEGESKKGFAFKYPRENLDDMELFDDIAAMNSGNAYQLGRIIERVLGAEQKKEYYEFLRDDSGRVKVSVIEDDFLSIMQASNDSKN